jgi:hypothetical protein
MDSCPSGATVRYAETHILTVTNEVHLDAHTLPDFLAPQSEQ